MPLLVLPIEIIINNLLTLLSIKDLIEFSKVCKSTNEYTCIYLKCNNCNIKSGKKEDIYNFKICYECNNLICKGCQSFCTNYEYCDNIFCDNCLITELCDECEEYYNDVSNDEDY